MPSDFGQRCIEERAAMTIHFFSGRSFTDLVQPFPLTQAEYIQHMEHTEVLNLGSVEFIQTLQVSHSYLRSTNVTNGEYLPFRRGCRRYLNNRGFSQERALNARVRTAAGLT